MKKVVFAVLALASFNSFAKGLLALKTGTEANAAMSDAKIKGLTIQHSGVAIAEDLSKLAHISK